MMSTVFKSCFKKAPWLRAEAKCLTFRSMLNFANDSKQLQQNKENPCWIRTISYEESDGKLRKLYDRVKGPDNNVDNIMLSHSLRPHSMEAHMHSLVILYIV